jgi:hypothetical protein
MSELTKDSKPPVLILCPGNFWYYMIRDALHPFLSLQVGRILEHPKQWPLRLLKVLFCLPQTNLLIQSWLKVCIPCAQIYAFLLCIGG